ncbi:hypothetical protein BD289DRAFT_486176 [Coniella lustricola]|uniref:Uncharacterized protein n=1 Tax=Coniella lustricola TaxID=2025994 RepID=A0A2T2ZW14_9PEZI|nr:hypothetical protein BD289DRAFT_486176 [Coniella lustricola]
MAAHNAYSPGLVDTDVEPGFATGKVKHREPGHASTFWPIASRDSPIDIAARMFGTSPVPMAHLSLTVKQFKERYSEIRRDLERSFGKQGDELDALIDASKVVYVEVTDKMKMAQRAQTAEKEEEEMKKRKRSRDYAADSDTVSPASSHTMTQSPGHAVNSKPGSPDTVPGVVAAVHAGGGNNNSNNDKAKSGLNAYFVPEPPGYSDDSDLESGIFYWTDGEEDQGHDIRHLFPKPKDAPASQLYIYSDEVDLTRIHEKYWMTLAEARTRARASVRVVDRVKRSHTLLTRFTERIHKEKSAGGRKAVRAEYGKLVAGLQAMRVWLEHDVAVGALHWLSAVNNAVEEQVGGAEGQDEGEGVGEGEGEGEGHGDQCGDSGIETARGAWIWSRQLTSRHTLYMIENLRAFDCRVRKCSAGLTAAEAVMHKWEGEENRLRDGNSDAGDKKAKILPADNRKAWLREMSERVVAARRAGEAQPELSAYRSVQTMMKTLFDGWEDYDEETQGPGKDDCLAEKAEESKIAEDGPVERPAKKMRTNDESSETAILIDDE